MVEVRNTNLHSQTGCPATKIVSNARSCRHSLEAVVRTVQEFPYTRRS